MERRNCRMNLRMLFEILPISLATSPYLCYDIAKYTNEVNRMKISYNKLWKLLIDKRMSKADLRHQVGMSTGTMTKLRKEQEVSLDVLKRICELLDCNIGDIMDFYKE